jgi:AraC family transcriptional regulator
MEYRIEAAGALSLSGISLRIATKDGANLVDVPAFWDRVMEDGRWTALAGKADFGRLGVCGVCREFDMAAGFFTYSIAIDRPASMDGMPEGCESFEVPAATWGKFTSRGPLRPNFQDTIKRIYGEWLPSSEWKHAGSAEIEFYPEAAGPTDSPAYWCEYWVPLTRP